jgi:hypothetical protein
VIKHAQISVSNSTEVGIWIDGSLKFLERQWSAPQNVAAFSEKLNAVLGCMIGQVPDYETRSLITTEALTAVTENLESWKVGGQDEHQKKKAIDMCAYSLQCLEGLLNGLEHGQNIDEDSDDDDDDEVGEGEGEEELHPFMKELPRLIAGLADMLDMLHLSICTDLASSSLDQVYLFAQLANRAAKVASKVVDLPEQGTVVDENAIVGKMLSSALIIMGRAKAYNELVKNTPAGGTQLKYYPSLLGLLELSICIVRNVPEVPPFIEPTQQLCFLCFSMSTYFTDLFSKEGEWQLQYLIESFRLLRQLVVSNPAILVNPFQFQELGTNPNQINQNSYTLSVLAPIMLDMVSFTVEVSKASFNADLLRTANSTLSALLTMDPNAMFALGQMFLSQPFEGRLVMVSVFVTMGKVCATKLPTAYEL